MAPYGVAIQWNTIPLWLKLIKSGEEFTEYGGKYAQSNLLLITSLFVMFDLLLTKHHFQIAKSPLNEIYQICMYGNVIEKLGNYV